MNYYENEGIENEEQISAPAADTQTVPGQEIDKPAAVETLNDAPEMANVHNIPEEDAPQQVTTSAPEDCAQAVPEAAQCADASRPRSPFENSPYVMQHAPGKTSARPRKKKGAGKIIGRIMCVVIALAILIGSCVITASISRNYFENQLSVVTKRYDDKLASLQKQMSITADGSGNSVSGSPAPVGDGMTPSQVYAANVKSVVMIYAEVSATVFGQVSKSASTGSGFIITENGYVVTNYHVVENATALSVSLYDGSSVDAELIGADSANDVALLKMNEGTYDPVEIGSSSKLIVGDQVVAIGNPLGELTSTLTVGYVSAKERDVSTDGTVINMIQTDAAINSGNSGGPLFNMLGQVVGITTAKYSGTSNSGATIEGIGFAIPIDDVYDMLDDLKNYGYITGAYMGIEVSDTDPNAATYFGYPVGAYVHGVEKGSCAEKAGIQAKDVIIALGEYEVGGLNDLSRALRKYDAGDTAKIVVYRLGQEIELSITFDAKPQSNSTP